MHQHRLILALAAVVALGAPAARAALPSPSFQTETLAAPPTWTGQTGVCMANNTSPVGCSMTLPSGLTIPAPIFTGVMTINDNALTLPAALANTVLRVGGVARQKSAALILPRPLWARRAVRRARPA